MSSTDQFNIQHNVLTASVPLSLIPHFLYNKLHPLLPYSLPLYRRCQFYLDECFRSDGDVSHQPHPELWVAMSQPAINDQVTSKDWLKTWLHSRQLPQSSVETPIDAQNQRKQDWIACHIDLREPGQTQVWFFGSWEATLTPLIMSQSPATESPEPTNIPSPTHQQALLTCTLYNHLRANHICHLPTQPSSQYLTMKAAGKVVSSPYKRSKILFGTIAGSSWWILRDNIVLGHLAPLPQEGDMGGTSCIAREDRPYLKYILPLPLPSANVVTTGHSLSVKPLQDTHLQTVLDRSVIPRTLELLRALVTVGLFPADSSDPVAWGILGKDASLSSLHTEPDFRGKGLAEIVTREIISRTGTRFRSDWSEDDVNDDVEIPYAHTDVSVANVASRRVFEKIGAKVGWRVGWVEVDVGEA